MLDGFVRESNKIEGILRPPLDAEIHAHTRLLSRPILSVTDLEAFVSAVQPGAILRREKGLNVRVGDHIAPVGGAEIEAQLAGLLERTEDCTGHQPFEIHQWYEKLHPFTDGNGRSGRAVWLWMMKRRNALSRAFALGFLHNWYYQSLSANRQ